MKKIVLMLLTLCLITSCSLSKENNKEEIIQPKIETKQKEEVKEENVHENINAIYVTSNNGKTLKDDFYKFNENGTFTKQSNHCDCMYVVEGTYSFTKEDGKLIINLIGKESGSNEEITAKLEYSEDEVKFIEEEDNDSEEYIINSSYFKQGCDFDGITFTKTTKDQIKEQKSICKIK